MKKIMCISLFTFFLAAATIIHVEAATKEFYDSSSNATNVPVINFHRISNDLDQYPDVKKITVDTNKFEQILIRLKNEGYTTLSEDEFIGFYTGINRVPVKSVLLTIDDGYADVYENAFPLLKKYNMKAVIFPITSDVDKGTRFNAPMMTYIQMKEMVDSGLIDIGSHSHDLHWRGNGYQPGYEAMIYNKDKNGKFIPNRYDYIKADTLLAEEKIFNGTGVKVDSISFPFGAYDETAISVFKNLGYKVGYTLKTGLNMYGEGADNPFEAKRFISVTYQSSPDQMINSLNDFQKQAQYEIAKNKDIYVATSGYNEKTGLYVTVQSLSDMKRKKNSIQSIEAEVFYNQHGKRIYAGISPMSQKVSKSFSAIQFYENFFENYYNQSGNYSMKIIMTRTNGTREIEWINYDVRK